MPRTAITFLRLVVFVMINYRNYIWSTCFWFQRTFHSSKPYRVREFGPNSHDVKVKTVIIQHWKCSHRSHPTPTYACHVLGSPRSQVLSARNPSWGVVSCPRQLAKLGGISLLLTLSRYFGSFFPLSLSFVSSAFQEGVFPPFSTPTPFPFPPPPSTPPPNSLVQEAGAWRLLGVIEIPRDGIIKCITFF